MQQLLVSPGVCALPRPRSAPRPSRSAPLCRAAVESSASASDAAPLAAPYEVRPHKLLGTSARSASRAASLLSQPG